MDKQRVQIGTNKYVGRIMMSQGCVSNSVIDRDKNFRKTKNCEAEIREVPRIRKAFLIVDFKQVNICWEKLSGILFV